MVKAQSKKLVIGITAEGSVNLLRGQLRAFKELGYDSYLLAPSSERVKKFCADESCTHLFVNIKRDISIISDLRSLFKILLLFRSIRPDVINVGTPKVSLLGMIAGWLLGIKLRIYTCRGFRFEHETGLQKSILVLMEKVTARLAHKVICISPSVRDMGVSMGIFTESKAVVINHGSSNGVDISLFDPEKPEIQKQAIDYRKKLGLEDHLVFGFIGRLVDRKGLKELYEAFDALYKEGLGARLLLVGPFEESQIVDKTLISKFKTHSAIVYAGRVLQDEVPAYMACLDVFVLPAWWEGFGNVLIQASAMGIPVISTDATGTKDAVSDGYSGILVPVKDTQELKSAMLRLASNKEERERLAQNGLTWAQNFKREDIWQGLHELYSQ